jgi:hypothetical protein
MVFGMHPERELNAVEMVSQILAFLFYLDPLTSSLTASSIAVASIQLAC